MAGALTILVAVGVVMALVWAFQRSLIYFPDTTEVPLTAEALSGGEDLTLRTSDGLHLGAWFAPASAEAEDRALAVLMTPETAETVPLGPVWPVNCRMRVSQCSSWTIAATAQTRGSERGGARP